MSRSSAGFSRSASASASHRISRPSASVLPISTVMPLRVRMTSSGRKALPETAFSTAGTSTRSRTGSRAAMTAWARPSTVAAPPMSFFISRMPAGGLRSSPPVSKHTPLPTSVTFGAARVAPGEVDQPRRAARWRGRRRGSSGSSAASSSSPTITVQLGAVPLGQRPAAAAASSAGPMSLGRRVDEVARQADRLRPALDLRRGRRAPARPARRSSRLRAL